MSKQKQDSNFVQRLGMLVCTAVVILAILAGLSYALWRMVVQVEPGILAAWALIATALLPLLFYGGTRWGDKGARGTLDGLALGIGTAVETAQKVADVKVQTARAIRAPMLPPQAVLPDVIDITPRQLNGGRDIIV